MERHPILLLALLLGFMLSGCARAPLYPFENDNGFYGFRKENGKIAIAPKYVDAETFSGCCAYAADEMGWVVINRREKKLFRPFLVNQKPDAHQEGLARFVQNGKVGYYDADFKVRIPPRFVYAGAFNGGFARFCGECRRISEENTDSMSVGKWGFINTQGEVIVDPEFDYAFPPANGTFLVMMGKDILPVTPAVRNHKQRPSK